MKKLFEILFGIYYVSTIYFFIFLFFIANKETKNIVIIIITVLIISCVSFRLVNYILEDNTDKEYKDKIKIKFFQDIERIKEGFNRNSNIIIFLTISLIFSYCIWKQIPLIFTIKDDFKSIGENLFFNFLFIGITVFTIDYMKEKIKEQEEKPIKEAVYNRIAKIFEKFNFLCIEMCRYYYLYKDIEISKINKQTLEKELKEILDVLKNFNKEYKKEWNREIKLSYSETEVECIDKNQEEV